jgi:hypothetical protein
LSTPVSPTNSGLPQFAQNKSHPEGNSSFIKLETNQYKVETHRRNSVGFFHFLCGFLAALDLSAVPLYGDDRSIASSASNCGAPTVLLFRAEQKPNWLFIMSPPPGGGKRRERRREEPACAKGGCSFCGAFDTIIAKVLLLFFHMEFFYRIHEKSCKNATKSC